MIPGEDDSNKALIREAMDDLQTLSCVKFIEGANKKGHFLQISSDSSSRFGCFSYTGYYYQARQPLNLLSSCIVKRSILHELMHALGFFHEHQSSNRDDYVEVNTDNVLNVEQFEEHKPHEGTDFGYGYDVLSIMHYEPYADSTQGTWGDKVLKAKVEDGGLQGIHETLSIKDWLKLNAMYKCPKAYFDKFEWFTSFFIDNPPIHYTD